MLQFNDVILSGNSSKDFIISQFNPATDIVDDKDYIMPMPALEIILDQLWTSSCGPSAISKGRAIQEYKQSRQWIDFDPYVLYGTRPLGTYQGEGVMLRETLGVLKNEGMYFRRDFNKVAEVPELLTLVKDFKANNPALVAVAKEYAISGYARVSSDNNIKKSIKAGMPVVGSWALFDSFINTGSDGLVANPNGSEGMLGHHAMLIVGWRSDGRWIVVNSWSNERGYKGLYYIPFAYRFIEGWSISDNITPLRTKAGKVNLWIDSPNMDIDGTIKVIDSAPILAGDRTLEPVRVITEALGASVEWNAPTQTIVVRSPEAVINMKIGDSTYTINGSVKQMDTCPIIGAGDRTLVPIRVISETLNCDVSWEEATQKITIECK